MALLNWGNALSQAGKAMATVGLEGVKSTLEHDKIRLAADLAEQSAKRAETRLEEAGIRAEGRQWTNEQAQRPIRASWVKQAKQDEIDLATDPRNLDKINAAKKSEADALDQIQTDIDTKHANDPLWKAAQRVKYDALNPYAAADAAYRNIMTKAETFKLDTATSIKDLTDKIAAETDPVKKQALVDKREAAAWSIEGDRAERLASRAERASVGTYIASQQTELARLKQAGALDKDPDVEAIRSGLPGFQALYTRLSKEAYPDLKVPDPGTAAPDPAPAPGAPGTGTGAGAAAPGNAAAAPAALPPFDGLKVTPEPGVLNRIGNAFAAGARMERDITANATSGPNYPARADAINAAFSKAAKNRTEVEIPGGLTWLNSVMNFDPKLLDPSVRGWAAGVPKPGSPSASGGTPRKVISYGDLP